MIVILFHLPYKWNARICDEVSRGGMTEGVIL